MNTPVEAYIGLGANIGDAAAAVERAFDRLDQQAGIRVIARSSLYRTPAWGVTEQPDFINAVAEIATTLGPLPLLEALLAVEREAGRDRRAGERWGPRVLDLDVLLYGDAIIEEPGLRVPHPHLHERAFVLVPLAEVAPSKHVPGHGPVVALRERVASGDIQALR
ncbi:2-amino-4-hydroxy-6-hydroxymethyldihydropteridine diphosphokinase [Lysobacter sp. TY2-98]|uniref:2-amino-4-hydroxy-6- hydroxymethyldihydropteridine diphosphokinase n=1 Tax=Lysobacter sp. TY2-98 TaxID=2290922 RepID=UPI000E20037E|nr:2-amino-4-hydroxy-6-hydroxymethyldihydropteridine diphosphokinase [Lysobacter sp. TY2-98]AXK71961.1 2-amino-4-hydroxy-6-hydroxymethyldihydropteridine diphosphokinase [Lysobacter sp. TY2-98]